MSLKSIMIALVASFIALFAAGCSNDNDTPAEENAGSVQDGQSGEGIDTHTSSELELDEDGESGIGFELNSEGNVEAAEDVPAEEEQEILATFDRYISTFNEKDIDGYMATLSDKTGHFNLEEEREAVLKVFESFDVEREVELKTINEYDENEAQVYADLVLTTTDPSTGAEVTRSGRQITVFNLVDGEWKIVSIHFMANPV